MTWANTNGAGEAAGAGPYVAGPRVNRAYLCSGVGFVRNVVFVNGNAHNQSTYLMSSTGDDSGIAGVKSGTVGGIASYTGGSTTVYLGPMPATRLFDPTLQNTCNHPGAVTVPSQLKVKFLS